MYSKNLWGKRSFCLFKTFCKFPIPISSLFQSYRFLFKLSIFVALDFQKTKSDATVLIKLCLLFTSTILISFIRVFVPFLYCHGLWSFLRCLFLLLFFLLLLMLSLFCLVFISGQNFISSNKDVAASTAIVELIVRTTTLTIVYYSRKLPSNKFL